MADYDAFVSYSHAKDKPIAAALQSVVQRLGKPWHRRRALRVFRDDTSLSATPSLWPSIEQALGNSRFLILLASPAAAASPWVNKEISFWLNNKSPNTLLIALTDGELAWDNAVGDFLWCEGMPLPPALTGRFASEPKWVDLRAYRDGADARDARFIESGADFAATIHGMPKEDLLSQEVRQQRRALRLAWSAAGSLAVLISFAGWQWWEADAAKRRAEAAFRLTLLETKRATAERDRALKSFQIAKETARSVTIDIASSLRTVHGMRTETVQRILDTARQSIDKLAQAEPSDLALQMDRAFVLRQFVQTYLDLGELSSAHELANESLSIMRKLVAVLPTAGVQLQLSATLDLLGDVARAARDGAGALEAYEESATILRKAIAIEPTNPENPRYLGSILQRIGFARQLNGDHKGARAAFEESLAIINKLAQANPDNIMWQDELSLVLASIGDARRLDGDWVGAAVAYEVSVSIVRKLVLAQPDTLSWQSDLSSLLNRSGTARLAAGDREGAFAAYKEMLAIARKLVAADSARVDWQKDLAISLYRLSTVSAPISAVRAMLHEAELILDALGKLGRLSATEQSWLRYVREDLAKLPPVK